MLTNTVIKERNKTFNKQRCVLERDRLNDLPKITGFGTETGTAPRSQVQYNTCLPLVTNPPFSDSFLRKWVLIHYRIIIYHWMYSNKMTRHAMDARFSSIHLMLHVMIIKYYKRGLSCTLCLAGSDETMFLDNWTYSPLLLGSAHRTLQWLLSCVFRWKSYKKRTQQLPALQKAVCI